MTVPTTPGPDPGHTSRTDRWSSDRFRLLRGGEGIITGTVVCAAVIAASAGHITTTGSLLSGAAGTALGVVIALMKATLH